jgi:hypothetical protein
MPTVSSELAYPPAISVAANTAIPVIRIGAGCNLRCASTASGTVNSIAGSARPCARIVPTSDMPGGRRSETTEMVLGTVAIAKGTATTMSSPTTMSSTGGAHRTWANTARMEPAARAR